MERLRAPARTGAHRQDVEDDVLPLHLVRLIPTRRRLIALARRRRRRPTNLALRRPPVPAPTRARLHSRVGPGRRSRASLVSVEGGSAPPTRAVIRRAQEGGVGAEEVFDCPTRPLQRLPPAAPLSSSAGRALKATGSGPERRRSASDRLHLPHHLATRFAPESQ